MKISGVILVLASVSGGFAADAFAWGAIGHATVGEIADRALTPRARNLVFRILGSEPLSVAANWPDEVRSDKKYDAFKPYHFAIVSPSGSYADIPHPSSDMNSLAIKAMKMLAKPSVSRDEKMLYLRYLVHIVGDIHQPLHTSIPGTYGGNACFVKVTHPVTGVAANENFHHFWDETLIEFEHRDYAKRHPEKGKDPWFGYFEYADTILADPAAEGIRAEVDRAGTARDSDFVTWITDAGKIGEAAYPKVAEKIAGRRPYCGYTGSSKPEENTKIDYAAVPTLDDAYAAKWIPTVRSQILRGGFRLAKVLDRIAEVACLKPLDPKKEAKLLESVLDK